MEEGAQRLNVLGLGIDPFFWRRVTEQLEKEFFHHGIELAFFHMGYKWSGFKEKGLELMHEVNPDIVFTSLSLFKHLEDLDHFFQMYEPDDIVDPPILILMDKKPHRFLSQYIKIYSHHGFPFINGLDLSIDDIRLFSRSTPMETRADEIKPSPVIESKHEDKPFLDSQESVQFFLWKEMKSITWNGATYKPREFQKLQEERLDRSQLVQHFRGILFERGTFYLSPGFLLRDLVQLKTDRTPIEHIITFEQFREEGKDYHALLFKLIELSKKRCSIRFNEHILADREFIKATIPILVSSEVPVIAEAFNSILQQEGYSRVVRDESHAELVDTLLLHLSFQEQEDRNDHFYAIRLEERIRQIPGFEELSGQSFGVTAEKMEDLDVIRIQKQRKQTLNQLEKLKSQIKVLSSSKMLDDQKRYMDMMAENKLQVLKNLLEIAEVWNEQTCAFAVASTENVLIIFDDKAQAARINQELKNNDRKLFLDVVKELDSLETIVSLNTDHLEAFLHDGVVICSVSAKALLVKKFQQYQQELSDREYPPLADAISSLEAELGTYESKLKKISYLEVWSELRSVYREYEDRIFEEAATSYRILQGKRFSKNRHGTIGVISSDMKSCLRIKDAMLKAFPEYQNSEFALNYLKLELKTSQENPASSVTPEPEDQNGAESEQADLSEENALILSHYFRSLAGEVEGKHYDLLVLEGDLEIMGTFIRLLWEANEDYKLLPLILVASGFYSVETMRSLAFNGVKVFFQNQGHPDSPDVLADALKTVMTII